MDRRPDRPRGFSICQRPIVPEVHHAAGSANQQGRTGWVAVPDVSFQLAARAACFLGSVMAKKRDEWKDEVAWATAICAPLGCIVTRSTHDYEIAVVKGDGVQLVIYPHKTGRGHRHARVRNNGSKNATRAREVLHALDKGVGLPEDIRPQVQFTCTFSVKNHRSDL
jgi:hypothetical protein